MAQHASKKTKKTKKPEHHNNESESETEIDAITEAPVHAADSEDEVIEAEYHAVKDDDSSEESVQNSKDDTDAESAEEKARVEFPYSDLVRAYVPQAMNVADKVADDWKKNGSFNNLGIQNPYANMAVSMGLQKAKELEKKLDEKGVLSVVRMGVEVIKQQVNKRK